MSNFWSDFLLTFVPLFIVIDAIGNLPFVIALTEESTHDERWRIINLATITAAAVGLFFLFLGSFILRVMNISGGAFAIAGGIILMVFAIRYMTTGHMVEVIKEEMVAVVPIGTPLTVGPATITTLILLSNQYPLYVVFIAFALNVFIAWLTFVASGLFMRVMGRGGLRAISRVFSLLLAALAVSMVIRGLELINVLPTPLT